MGENVTVGCKLPHGIVLDLRDEKGVVLKSVTLSGTAMARRLEIEGNVVEDFGHITAGFALTEVDKGFWDAWAAQNEDYAPYKTGAIFAAPKLEGAKSEARNRKKLETGLEPIDPDKPGAGIEELKDPVAA